MTTARPQPLAGITVIDLTQIYNGPYATYLMAMAGAKVIKVEPPTGEHLRQRGATSGAALPFAMLNGNKQSVTLNLKSDEGRDLLLRLAEKADVFVENFAPGTIDRLGVGWEILRKLNPRLICASGSGYGSDGPYRDYPAMDLTVQAISGVMSVTGAPDGPPMKAGPAVCDFFGGIHLYSAIATALFERERTGRGRAVEVSMMEAVYASLSSNLGLFYGSRGKAPMRTGNRHGGLSLCPYNVYPAKDGFIAIICNHEAHWQSLLRAMERKDLGSDTRCFGMTERVRNMAFVDDLVSSWSARYPKQELFEKLIKERVPCAPVRTLDEVIADPHLHARGFLEEIDHPEFGRITVARSPLRFIGSALEPLKPSPVLGSNNRDVFNGWLGLSDTRLDALRDMGAI
ncbi:MAG: CoA transferase [Candidatus Acidiferrales bacterium]|jgi:formyl-CoA transferase